MKIQAPPNVGGPQVATTLDDWVKWQSATARALASCTSKMQRTRWTHSAMKRLWSWAGHVTRLDQLSPTRVSTEITAQKRGRGRPMPTWSTPLQRLSIHELGGSNETWQEIATNAKTWAVLATTFTEFAHSHIMSTQARDSLRRDEQA